MQKKWRLATQSIHYGENRKEPYYSVTTPIIISAPFKFYSTKDLHEYITEKSQRTQPEYGRMGNPTVTMVQEKLAKLEGGESGLLFASGMCAITTALLVLLKKDDHVIITNDSYRRTRDFIVDFLSKFGIKSAVVQPSSAAIKKAITKKTKVIFTESPTNPYLRILNLKEVAEIGKQKKITTIVDNTFGTPINQKPLEYGIDLIVHAITKYLGGHNDIIAGALIGSQKLVEPIAEMLMTIGGICDPATAFLIDRGLKTLVMRVEHHNESGRKIAEFLETHPKIKKVYYPGLESHPDHEIAKKQMKGFGGVVTFLLKTDFKGAMKFIDRLQIPQIAPSFGGPESLVDPPALMSFWDLTKKERDRLGVYENLIRYSAGLEDVNDLIEDLKSSLDKI